jgi:peroxin-3
MNESTISLENHDDDNTEEEYGNDFETNRKYLSLTWWLLHRGWKDVMLKVQGAVEEVFGTLKPRDDVTMERFSELTIQVRKRVEGITEADRRSKKWLQYLLPPRDQEDFVLKQSGMASDPTSSPSSSSSSISPLRRLLDETSDLIDSPPFSHVLTLLLDAGFSLLVDQKIAQQAFKVPPTSDVPDLNAPRLQEIVDVKPVKLPILLARLAEQAHKIGNGVPNEYVQAMDQVRDLEAFAAVVYSSNWESQIAPLSEEGPTKRKGSSADEGVNIIQDYVEESVADVEGTTSTFESAWDKAVDSIDKESVV